MSFVSLRAKSLTFCILWTYLFTFLDVSCQTSKADSIGLRLAQTLQDTSRVNALNKLAWEIRESLPDSAINLSLRSLALAQKINWELGIAQSNHMLGVFYNSKGSYPASLDHYFKALSTWERIYPPAGGQNGASTLGNIGIVYFGLNDYAKALNYYERALKINETLNNRDFAAGNLLNMGLVYSYQRDYTKALDLSFRALKIFEELKNKSKIASAMGAIGTIYYYMGDYHKAEEYYLKVLKANEEMGSTTAIAIWYGNIGSLYVAQEKYKDARIYLGRALDLSKKMGDIDGCKTWCQSLMMLDSITGNFKGAFENYKMFIAFRDSLANTENTKKLTRIEMQYDFDKKVAHTKAEQEKKDAVTNVIIYSISAGLALMLVLAALIFYSYRQKKKANQVITQQKHEVERQKHLVEEKQKEMLDSIYYARRIQRSLLTTEKYIQARLTTLQNRK